MPDWSYDKWPSGEPYDWMEANRGTTKWDAIDYHVDLGCGRVKKARIGIDRYPAPGVNIVMDLDKLRVYGLPAAAGYDAEPIPELDGVKLTLPEGRLPFPDSSIESMISHHALEHIGDGFIPLMDECYRVLKPGAIFRIIVPLFPSWSAVSDPDHKRYFCADANHSTFDSFCGTPGETPHNCWLASFSVPYTQARFEKVDHDISPFTEPQFMFLSSDSREHRVALKAVK